MNLTPSRRKIGPLDAIAVETDPNAPTVVLFHGYGAGCADLAPLALELPGAESWNWIFPDGIVGTEGGGRAWFPIDPEVFEKIQFEGVPWDGGERTPKHYEETMAAVGAFFKALGRPWGSLVLGGFSQGAMLAAELALAAPEAPRGLMIFSGGLFTESRWRALAPKRKGLRFMQSHGRQDPILDFAAAQRLEKLLTGAGLSGRLLAFDGGHGIPPEALGAAGELLGALR